MTPQDDGRGIRQKPYTSHGERSIARLLTEYDIPFIYEKPTAVVDSGKTKIWYPDFTLSYGLLVEYFGFNGSRDYRTRTEHKLRVYAENQIDVLPVYSKDLDGAWQRSLLSRIDSALEDRVRDYRKKTAQTYSARPYETARYQRASYRR